MWCTQYYRHHNPFLQNLFFFYQREVVAMNESTFFFWEREKKIATFAQMTKNSFMSRTYGCSLLKGNMPVIRSFKCVYRHIQTLHTSVHATEHQAEWRLWTLPLQNKNVNRGWLKPGWAWNKLTVQEGKGFNQRLVHSAAKFAVWGTCIDLKSNPNPKLLSQLVN